MSFRPSFAHDASVPTAEVGEEPEEKLDGEEAHREPQNFFWRRSWRSIKGGWGAGERPSWSEKGIEREVEEQRIFPFLS
jgi:hypothetical protein